MPRRAALPTRSLPCQSPVPNYERAGAASPSEAEDVHPLAEGLQLQVVSWLEEHHPELRTASQGDRKEGSI